ncbi:hypothetical protein ACQJBY_059637 [Aegilops geniculata]
MRLQFDLEHEESYEEKRTMIGGLVRRTNLAIERHASKIYTRAMFEQFGRLLIERAAYNVTEVEKMIKLYYSTQYRSKKGEVEPGSLNEVMEILQLEEIPPRHIMKCWTRDARDILPDHLAHYQKENAVSKQ